jgi:dimethylaniline monooxygenase (N-oxide forming)
LCRGDVVVKPAIDQLSGGSVHFMDGSEERIDRIVYATGYRINFPYLSSLLVSADGRDLPLYRRMVRPGLPGLYFAGFVDAPGGLLPVVETQGQWIAAAITGQRRPPSPERMWQAIEQAESRTRERSPDESPGSVRCDPHAYRRLLHESRPSRWCTTLGTPSSSELYAAASIAFTSSGSSGCGVSALAIESALM